VEDQWLHLHRSEDWYESAFEPIPVEEWRACVDRHADLTPALEGAVTWKGHPGGQVVTLQWEDGRVTIDVCDEPTRIRMAALATELGVTLQSDDLTEIGPDGELILREDGSDWAAGQDDTADELVDPWEELPDVPPVWDPTRATSRGEFLRGLFRRD
jgi:hypothetical protein